MTNLRHPHIEPPVVIDVAEERVEAHLAAGWLPEEPPAEEAEPHTPERPRRNRRAGSEPSKETAE